MTRCKPARHGFMFVFTVRIHLVSAKAVSQVKLRFAMPALAAELRGN